MNKLRLIARIIGEWIYALWISFFPGKEDENDSP